MGPPSYMRLSLIETSWHGAYIYVHSGNISRWECDVSHIWYVSTKRAFHYSERSVAHLHKQDVYSGWYESIVGGSTGKCVL